MHGLGREVSHLRFSLTSKAEASRPTEPSERTPTALLEDKVMLWKITTCSKPQAECGYRYVVV